MDPEQTYQEVLAEEQQKGSAAPVAEGRAKAARSRAEHGSPHPKEPKWWPGSQPQYEGGDAGGGEEAPAEQATEEEPVAEEPAAEEDTAAEPAAEAAPEPEPEAPAEQPAPAAAAPAEEAPAQQPAAAVAAPAAAATATQTVPTTGVSYGTATGTRMRPEDGVATPAQLDGQQAMYERRRLIDEVIKTGVPAAAASQRDSSSSGALAVLYLLIPLLVIGFLALNRNDSESSEEGAGPPAEEGAPGGEGANVIVAVNTAFETEEISAEAGGTVSGTLENQDPVDHNLAVYESEDDTSDPESALFTSDTAAGGESVDYEFTAPDEPGEYPFICEFHPTTMTGTVIVEEAGGGGGSGGGGEG